MAFEQDLKILSFPAGADLRTSQFKAVELGTAGTVTACNGATDRPIGILQNKPNTGERADVAYFGVTKWQGDADLAVADIVSTSADGQAAKYQHGVDTTKYACGIVLTENGAAGGLLSVLVDFASIGRMA